MSAKDENNDIDIVLSAPICKQHMAEIIFRPEDEVVVKSADFRTINAPATYFLSQAFADIHNHAKGSMDREVGGFLLGFSGNDEKGRFINVTKAIRAHATYEARASLTFTHESWNKLNKEQHDFYPGLKVVGWYHTHPGYGLFYSADDAFIQRNFFSGCDMVGVVVDPMIRSVVLDKKSIAMYKWCKDELLQSECWCLYNNITSKVEDISLT